jgi:heptaprenyl diphosphate synthase
VVNPTEALGLPRLQEGLRRLEPLLTASVVTGDGFLDQVTTHLIAAGGKRLRPLLALATATAGDRDASQEDLMGGVAVELVHLASLYHDDVIDEATIRRNVESVNSRFGNLVAIVAGDYLLARSAAIAASLGTEIAALLAETLGRLCQGQVTEVRSAFQIGRSRADYIETISGKTAALTAASCRIGALTGGLPATEVDACTEYGRCFGMVFQIRDDILDITATDGELQKSAGQDLAEGIYTLPTLIALDDSDAGPDLRPLLGQPLAQPERDKARQMVAASSGISTSVDEARAYVDGAQAATAGIAPAALRAGLSQLAAELLSDLPG